MADGFLGRWSQRKQAVRAGLVPDEPQAARDASIQQPTTSGANTANLTLSPAGSDTVDPAPTAAGPGAAQPAPLPTLADVRALTPDSSFAPFVSRGVAPEVRNAAMKKLFTDPHFNVMDRLDIYIDDYSLADPIPAAMLRQMDSAKFLKLFDDDPKAAAATELPPQPVSAEANPITQDPLHHDHTDLRLQPDHAPGPTLAQRVAGRDPDTAFEPVPPSGP